MLKVKIEIPYIPLPALFEDTLSGTVYRASRSPPLGNWIECWAHGTDTRNSHRRCHYLLYTSPGATAVISSQNTGPIDAVCWGRRRRSSVTMPIFIEQRRKSGGGESCKTTATKTRNEGKMGSFSLVPKFLGRSNSSSKEMHICPSTTGRPCASVAVVTRVYIPRADTGNFPARTQEPVNIVPCHYCWSCSPVLLLWW